MTLAIMLSVALSIVLLPCLAAAFLVSPLACFILAAVIALAPAACAWWLSFIERRHAARFNALRVIDRGRP